MRGFILTIIFAFLINTAWSQVEKGEIRSGNSAYKKGNYQKAEIDYRRALEKNPNSIQAKYNLGNALYKLNNAPEAEKVLTPVADSVADQSMKADVFHNIGNFSLAQKKYKESVDSYKNSLRIHPGDMQTKSNLAYAQKMLKNEQDKQKKDQNKDQNKDDKKDQDKNKNKDQNKDQNKDNKDKQQQPPPKITPQAAQQMLQAIQNKEKETQEKVNREKVKVLEGRQKEKNW
ncbi:MAG: tetratricopeptide repeat protein [Bacteroidales bacterium]|jgi:tetratricopeptide (TPR) repeat protein